MVARVVTAWNKLGVDTFAVPPAKRSSPPTSEVENNHGYITVIINGRNLSRKPTTSRIICLELQPLTDDAIPDRTVRAEPKKREMTYIRGRKRDPRADSKVNVAFRNVYVEKKEFNLNARLYPKNIYI